MKIISKILSKEEHGSAKFGIELDDHNVIEAVIFPKDNYTMCLSSQVGCPMSCIFCESGKNGLIRNLNFKEMLGQFILINNYVKSYLNKDGVNYVVIMGIGEPLLNYENVTKFIKKIHKDSKTTVAICTSGIVNNIYRLIKEKIPVKLYVSLHSTNQTERKKIMPIASKYHFNDLIKAIKAFEQGGNGDSSVDIHYLIFDKLNDKKSDARKLVSLFKKGNFKIIIKSVCPISDQKYFEAKKKRREEFISILKNNGLPYYYSVSRGREIKGGCGQLRSHLIKTK